MKKFNPNRKCPKCGFNSITDKFFKKGGHTQCTVSNAFDRYMGLLQSYRAWSGYGLVHKSKEEELEFAKGIEAQMNGVPEHIERTCLRCGFVWAEATLDECT